MTLDSLTAHAEATSSTSNYLLLSILNLSSSETLFHAASHLGIAQTIATLLRALPYHASKRRMIIPASITAKHHVSQEEVFLRGPDAANITDAVYDFAVVANDHLITAREMFKADGGRLKVPREAMPVLLGAVSLDCQAWSLGSLRLISHYISLWDRFQQQIIFADWKLLISMRLNQSCKCETASGCLGKSGGATTVVYSDIENSVVRTLLIYTVILLYVILRDEHELCSNRTNALVSGVTTPLGTPNQN